MTPVTASLDGSFVTAFRSGTLTAAQVEAALPRDRPAVIFLLLKEVDERRKRKTRERERYQR